MTNTEVASVEWEKIPALELRAGPYKAQVIPGFGGHLISFGDDKTAFLRKPVNLGAYLILPEAYGLPVLFPPNFIDGCGFRARGTEYHLPANKAGGTRHFHGLLYQRSWQVDRISNSNTAAELDLSFTSPAGGEVYRWFPHPFCARLQYRLEEGRLTQEISFENRDDRPMPMMLGFHTAFALPDRAQDPEAYRIRIGIGDGLKADVRSPAEAPMTDFREGRILRKGESVFGQFYAGSFEDQPGRPCHGALIENLRTGKKLRYTTDEQFGYWVIWNQNGDDSFLCIEPQTCAINAANMHQEQDLFGFKMLDAGKTFSAKNSFTVE
ncbi:galactose mutarotase [Spirochaetia bacterium]|nr:galactose mutarotase [Spirochaetia bacterium]